MRKLIELDAALDALRKVIVPAEDIGFGDELTDGYNDGIEMAITVVSGLPSVDAVTVVRCKDCASYQINFHWCGLHYMEMHPKDFCSYGERKDGDHHD